ncbi:hypothetical protein N7501_010080 [Penicillium viridicatum]|nr:hypothetical protein N7501_010080 [Penicillium viridicatum]
MAPNWLASILSLAGAVFAHPGHDIRAEAAERASFLENAPVHQRSLAQCASKLKARGHENANVVRRANCVKTIRQKRGLQHSGFQSMYLHAQKDEPHYPDVQFHKARSLNSVLNTDHNSTLFGVSPFTYPSVLFGSETTKSSRVACEGGNRGAFPSKYKTMQKSNTILHVPTSAKLLLITLSSNGRALHPLSMAFT